MNKISIILDRDELSGFYDWLSYVHNYFNTADILDIIALWKGRMSDVWMNVPPNGKYVMVLDHIDISILLSCRTRDVFSYNRSFHKEMRKTLDQMYFLVSRS